MSGDGDKEKKVPKRRLDPRERRALISFVDSCFGIFLPHPRHLDNEVKWDLESHVRSTIDAFDRICGRVDL